MRAGRRGLSAVALAALVALVAACGTSTTSARSGTPSSRSNGKSLTVLLGSSLEGDWSAGLDPATDSDYAANLNQLDAIYGELFELNPSGQLVYDLATGYRLTDDFTQLTIRLRHGVKFSDGTPFDAAAVVDNFERDFGAGSESAPTAFTMKSVSAPNAYTVVMRLTSPDSAIVDQFQGSSVNWIASPAAIRKEGEVRFERLPVGAGPFEVVGDTYDSKLVLKRNPYYWQQGLPYLQNLTFVTTATDGTALTALESHEAGAYMGMGTPSLAKAYKAAGLKLTTIEGTQVGFMQVNALKAPFSNILAREALYYATNVKGLDYELYGQYGVSYPPSESFTSAAGLFYDPTVPDYRSYDLTRARQLVSRLGGLSFEMFRYTGEAGVESRDLASMYEAAGMTVTYEATPDLGTLIDDLATGNWQAGLSGAGDWDPSMSDGVAFRFKCTYAFSGICSTRVDKLMTLAVETSNQARRKQLYEELASYLNQEAYASFLFPAPMWDVVAKGVTGAGLSTPLPDVSNDSMALWQYADVS